MDAGYGEKGVYWAGGGRRRGMDGMVLYLKIALAFRPYVYLSVVHTCTSSDITVWLLNILAYGGKRKVAYYCFYSFF